MNYLARNIEVPNLKTLTIGGRINIDNLKKLLKRHKGTLRKLKIMAGCFRLPDASMVLEFTRQHLSLDRGQPVIFYRGPLNGKSVLGRLAT